MRHWLNRSFAIWGVMVVVGTQYIRADEPPTIWDQSVTEASPLTLMVDEAPSLDQLRVARSRTDITISDKSNFKAIASSLWLQANLEYQAFLAAPDKIQRRLLGQEVARRLARLRSVITEASSADVSPEWNEALIFANSMEGTVRPFLAAERQDADTLVRNLLFELVSPAEGQGSVHITGIRNQISGTQKKIETLVFQSIAARVQAALVLQLAYGQDPKSVKNSFRRDKEVSFIYPDGGRDGEKLTAIVDLVALISPKGGPDPGIVGKYQLLAEFIKLENGRLAEDDFEAQFPETTDWKKLGVELSRLDQAYASPEGSKDKQTFQELVDKLNVQSKALGESVDSQQKLKGILLDPADFVANSLQFSFEDQPVGNTAKVPKASATGLSMADQQLLKIKQIHEVFMKAGDTEALPTEVIDALVILHRLSVIQDGMRPTKENARAHVDEWIDAWLLELVPAPVPAAVKQSRRHVESKYYSRVDSKPDRLTTVSNRVFLRNSTASRMSITNSTTSRADSEARERPVMPNGIPSSLYAFWLGAIGVGPEADGPAEEKAIQLTKSQVLNRLLEAEEIISKSDYSRSPALAAIRKVLTTNRENTTLEVHQQQIVQAFIARIDRHFAENVRQELDSKLKVYSESVRESTESLTNDIGRASNEIEAAAATIASSYGNAVKLHTEISQSHVSAENWFSKEQDRSSLARLHVDLNVLNSPEPAFQLSEAVKVEIQNRSKANRAPVDPPTVSATDIERLHWLEGQQIWWRNAAQLGAQNRRQKFELVPATPGYLAEFEDVMNFAPGVRQEGRQLTPKEVTEFQKAWQTLRDFAGVVPKKP